MSEEPILLERDGAIATITLNRPDERNTMSPGLLDGFARAVAEVRAGSEIRCVIITGRGTCFSAGANLGASLQREDEPGKQPHERSFAMYEPFLTLLELDVPVIGALNGHAVGGGFGLALLCDIRIACRDARYGANFTRLGVHPGMAITYVLPRLIGVERAAELLFTGRLISGAEAERLGLVSKAVPADEVYSNALVLAREIAACAPAAVRMTKRSLYRHLTWDARQAAAYEAFAQAATLTTADAREGIAALLEKRVPAFTGE
jgi:enoyl-CoA hydratase/carnithine racemase